MLTKIMEFTFVITLVLVAVVASNWPALWNWLHPRWLTIRIQVLGIENIPTAYAVAALLIALAALISKLHDKVSDLFGIRELNEILIPLAGGTGIPVDLAKRERFIKSRDQIMGRVFYRYASSTKPDIDAHLVWTALDKWSWFWISIEATTIGTIALAVLILLHAFTSAAWVGAFVFLGTLSATQINRACASAAHHEVNEILSDGQRRSDIGAALGAI
jgi:hypothetical protein